MSIYLCRPYYVLIIIDITTYTCECIFKRGSDYINLVLLVFLASPPLSDPLCIQRTTTRRILGAGVGEELHTQWGPVLVGTACWPLWLVSQRWLCAESAIHWAAGLIKRGSLGGWLSIRGSQPVAVLLRKLGTCVLVENDQGTKVPQALPQPLAFISFRLTLATNKRPGTWGSGDTATQDVPSSTYFLPVCLICPRESSSGILQGACGCNDSKTSNNKVINLGLPQQLSAEGIQPRSIMWPWRSESCGLESHEEPCSPRISRPSFAWICEHAYITPSSDGLQEPGRMWTRDVCPTPCFLPPQITRL